MCAVPVCLAASIAYRVGVVQRYAINEVAFPVWQYPSFLGHYAIGVTLASFYANRKMRVAKFNSSFPSLIAVTSLLVSQYLIGSVYSISNNKAAFPGGTLCPRVRGLDQIRLDFAHRIESQERLHEPR